MTRKATNLPTIIKTISRIKALLVSHKKHIDCRFIYCDQVLKLVLSTRLKEAKISVFYHDDFLPYAPKSAWFSPAEMLIILAALQAELEPGGRIYFIHTEHKNRVLYHLLD